MKKFKIKIEVEVLAQDRLSAEKIGIAMARLSDGRNGLSGVLQVPSGAHDLLDTAEAAASVTWIEEAR